MKFVVVLPVGEPRATRESAAVDLIVFDLLVTPSMADGLVQFAASLSEQG
jgi:hypothetical protein